MKMKKIYAIVLLLLVIVGCKKEALIKESSPAPKDQGIKGEIVQLGGITVVKENGRYILGGDIVLSEAQVNYLRNFKPNKLGGKDTKSAFITDFVKLWPGGIVYYTINPGVYNTTIINDAIAEWESKTLIDFVERTTQTNYIEFVPSTRNYSKFGMFGNRQEVELASYADLGSANHEIGHALGLFHEMSRADAGSYINVHTSNINSADLPNFQSYATLGLNGAELGAYDFESVMSYPSFAGFEINSMLPSTTKKDGGWLSYIYHISAGDVDAINYLYDNANYKKIYVVRDITDIEDNSSYSWSQDNILRDYNVVVKFYEDINCTIPYTLVKPINIKAHHTGGIPFYILVPSGVQTYKIGGGHEEQTYEWGVLTYDNSYAVFPMQNHGYIGVGF